MRVKVLLTIDGQNTTVIEGDAAIFDRGATWDELESKGLGFWLSDYRLHQRGKPRHGRVFVNWLSTLYVEEPNYERQ